MTIREFFVAVAMLMAISMLLLGHPVKAQADGYCDYFGDCPKAKKKVYRKKHRAARVKAYRQHSAPWKGDFGRDDFDGRDDDKDRDCKRPVRGVGTQWIGKDGATEAAKKDWMERVRYDHGETYLDLSHAEGFEARCGRTSVGEVVGQVLFRCEVVARPCKAVFEKVEGQK